MNRKGLTASMDVSEGERSFVATITSDAIDRDGEVLLPQGMQPGEFQKNPVVFWNHDYSLPPIGKAVKMSRDRTGWTAKATLAERPENHGGEWLPDTVLALMQQGIIKGVSVGFEPVESRNPTPKDIEQFGGDGNRKLRHVYSKWNLLEFSVAPLPANQTALVQAVSKGIITPKAVADLGIDLPEHWEATREPEPPVVTPAEPSAWAVVDDSAAQPEPPVVTAEPRRVVVIVAPPKAAPKPRRKRIDHQAIIRKEIARAMGRLHV